MCELALDRDTFAQISAIPTRRTWFGIVGASELFRAPSGITDDADLAAARAKVASADFPLSGPFRVITLIEALP